MSEFSHTFLRTVPDKFPGGLFEEWLKLSFGDAPSLSLASGGLFSTTSVYNWLKGKSWPSGDAMLKLYELGCNILRFRDPSSPVFSDTAYGRSHARRSGRAVAIIGTTHVGEPETSYDDAGEGERGTVAAAMPIEHLEVLEEKIAEELRRSREMAAEFQRAIAALRQMQSGGTVTMAPGQSAEVDSLNFHQNWQAPVVVPSGGLRAQLWRCIEGSIKILVTNRGKRTCEALSVAVEISEPAPSKKILFQSRAVKTGRRGTVAPGEEVMVSIDYPEPLDEQRDLRLKVLVSPAEPDQPDASTP